MATKTRYKSSSPAPAPAAIATMTSAVPLAADASPIVSTLSKDIFPAAPRTEPAQQQHQRQSELAILNYHNARPSGQSSITLPPASTLAGDAGHVLGQAPTGRTYELPPPLPPQTQSKEEYPFGWHTEIVSHERHQPAPPPEKPRSLSIQSLITTPAGDQENGAGHERGMKRKGSEIMDDAMARSSRGTSVVSTQGLSMEDPDVRDAVEALGGLKADFAHPLTAPNSPPTTQQQEPLLNLIQSSASSVHPWVSTALSISSSTYAASKNYIPPFRYVAESAENVAAPVVRRTGLEGYIRRGLTRHRSNDKTEINGGEKKRRKSDKDTTASAEGQQLVEVPAPNREQRGWQTRLYYSSTGLATAISDESRRSLKYCLKILITANANLVKVIETLTSVVDELDQYLSQKRGDGAPPAVSIAGYLPESYEQRRQRLADTVDRLKDEALKTLKQVIDTISRYAGGALPDQARNVVKRQVLSFPARWQAATTSSSSASSPSSEDMERGVVVQDQDETGRKTKGKAVRVLMMAREGLDMMRGVAEVVEGTLVSAEQWCERIGKKTEQEETEKSMKRVSWQDEAPPPAYAETNNTPEREEDGDVTMAKAG